MPDILPISVPMPAAPAAPVAGVAPAAPVSGAALPADFMGQLAAALKGLKGIAAAVKALPTQAAATPAMPATDAAPDDGTPAATAKALAPSDDVTELMATLGLVLLPQPQTPASQTDAVATSAASAPVAALPQATQPLTDTSEAAQQLAAKLPPTPVEPEAVKHLTEHLPEPTKASPQTERAQPEEASVAVAVADAPPVAQHAPAPQAPTPSMQPHIQAIENTAFQQPSGGGAQEHHHSGSGTKSSLATETESVRTEVTQRPAFAEAALTQTTPVASAAPTQPQAVDVASQIAHQVDLYRLPGSKGVRIQLHPEDLGGVQVTVRYGSGGSLELHVNVEHAATGTLVQDGLNHLRDALATHGFEPDRIVMSVTAPAAASHMDFGSNGSGSYRSDPSMTAFSQDGQSGQQRSSDQDDARGPRAWSSVTDADDSPRAGSPTSSGTSVIDYRV